ncbi:MAG: N-6 DNA methylase [Candidatus Bathyarchaeota archaeon]|nr:N-6 DNA methylase [Candidatus Bathyarchaeota archaeon]
MWGLRESLSNVRLIKKLADLVKDDSEAFTQILLSVCSNETFRRIKHCPAYPLHLRTKDLEYRQNLLRKIVDSNSVFDIPAIFTILYESAIATSYRKNHGQYFTPPRIANDAIKDLALKEGHVILDAGCGTGTFAAIIMKQARERLETVSTIRYIGVENDPLLALVSALTLEFLDAPKEWQVIYANFLLLCPEFRLNTVISNPPFVRFHRLNSKEKISTLLGVSKFSGLHSFFVAHSAKVLKPERMLFILPSEMFGTNYGSRLLRELSNSYKTTSKAIWYNSKSKNYEVVEKRSHAATKEKATIVLFELLPISTKNVVSKQEAKPSGIKLGDVANVHRGISTGANVFFVLNESSVRKIGVPPDFLLKVVPPKTERKFLPDTFDESDWDNLRQLQRPCWILKIPEHYEKMIPLMKKIMNYLEMGKRQGIHMAPTCLKRKPWFSVRTPTNSPDFFFTYISRIYPKFIYNKAKAYNLTNLLSVYLTLPKKYSDETMNQIAMMLSEDIKNWMEMQFAGRIYSGGLIKFEPKNLEEMPISKSLQEILGVKSLEFPTNRVYHDDVNMSGAYKK